MTVVVPTYRLTATMKRKSGIEKDSTMNTWHFIAPSGLPSAGDYGNMMNVYQGFLDAIANDLSNVFRTETDVCSIEFFKYTAERPPPGTGLGPPTAVGFTQGWASAPTLNGYPSEVATCISLDGTSVTDAEHGTGGTRPAARKRNRKYIGPLAEHTGTADTVTKEVRPNGTWRNALTQAVVNQLINAAVAKGWALTGFSPTQWQTFPVKNVWVDDAFDTQRRRGELPTLQTALPAPGALEAYMEAHRREGHPLHVNDMGQLEMGS